MMRLYDLMPRSKMFTGSLENVRNAKTALSMILKLR